jgi:hypothetical protein
MPRRVVLRAADGDQIDGRFLHPALQRRIGQAPEHGPGLDARLERGQHALAQLGIGHVIPSALLQLPDGRKLWVDSWRKTLGREQIPLLEVTGNIVPPGL